VEAVETQVRPASPSETTAKEISTLSIGEESPDSKRIFFTIASVTSRNSHDAPKRGDLVTFSKGKGGKAKEVRVKKRLAATKIAGKLNDISKENDTATFLAAKGGKFGICLSDVVSCEKDTLKDNEAVEGIQHDGKIVGICRSADLYLESTIVTGSAKKERPKLNLTVKRELKGLGGKIIAQSGMAKGPDGTNGFADGWTSRESKFAIKKVAEDSALNVTAEEFTPGNFILPPTEADIDNNIDESGEASAESKNVPRTDEAVE